MKFVQAKFCGPVRTNATVIRLIVIHTMEAAEKPRTARNIAFWFASLASPRASTHYCIDADEVIQCVKEDTVAWGAPGANSTGIHLEHAGYAKQNLAGWADAYSMKMLERSAALSAEISKRYNIPIVKLSADDLFHDPKAMGFCGHVDVTYGRNAGHGHWDPGPHFPWDAYLAMVRGFLAPTSPPPENVA